MDQGALVDAAALARIASLFRAKGLPISGIYLISLTSEEGYSELVIRMVAASNAPDLARQMIYKLVELRRENALQQIDTSIRFDLVAPTHPEAARVLDYARKRGDLPVVIRDTMWEGLFIEFALVAELPQANFAVA